MSQFTKGKFLDITYDFINSKFKLHKENISTVFLNEISNGFSNVNLYGFVLNKCCHFSHNDINYVYHHKRPAATNLSLKHIYQLTQVLYRSKTIVSFQTVTDYIDEMLSFKALDINYKEEKILVDSLQQSYELKKKNTQNNERPIYPGQKGYRRKNF